MTREYYESKVEEIYTKYRKSIERFYYRQTGFALGEADIYQKKDMVGRWLFYIYFDRGFRQNGISDETDGFASGDTCEIKCNTYGFNELTQVIIDKRKVDTVGDGGRIVFIYPDFDNKTIATRQFLVKDIKKHGRLSFKGGRKNNVELEESDKPVYFVEHRWAEAEHIWKKEGRKS